VDQVKDITVAIGEKDQTVTLIVQWLSQEFYAKLLQLRVRGIEVVQIPTTVLAQVDASIGGKTGVNLKAGKNLVGSFHHPRAVLIDPAVLSTLPEREFRAGVYESLKCGVIGHPELFRRLESLNLKTLRRDSQILEWVITESVRLKAEVVASDEREHGLRRILNFGHTIGHALEAATGFSDRLFHGEGVAVGMVLSAEFSAQLGMIAESDAARVKHHLAAVGLPTRLQDIAGFSQEGLPNADALLALMAQDKKVKRGKLTFILLEAVGRAVIANDVEPSLVRDFLEAKLAKA